MKDRTRGTKLIMVDTHRIQSSLSFGIKKTIRAPNKGVKVITLKIGKLIYFPSSVCSISFARASSNSFATSLFPITAYYK
jgi:hypothetical protein